MRGLIDRVQEGLATLLLGEDESVSVTVPLEWLPPGVREGDVLAISCALDPGATADALQEVRTLLKELGDEP